MVSVIANLALALMIALAVFGHGQKSPLRVIFRYFTVQSNVLCAVSALAVAACRVLGGVPLWVLLLKYVGTAAVTVTFLTVLCFLGPTMGYGKMFGGPDLWLHLIAPVLALVSWFAWDKPAVPFAAVVLGMLPVVLYSGLYLYKVLYAPEGRRWEDFYGFNKGGKWPVSCAAMVTASFLISFALWKL